MSWAYLYGTSKKHLLHLLGSVLSLTAVNRVTLKAQKQMEARRQSLIEQTPPILIVDGVWIDILYTLDEKKLDRAGHLRQMRQAQERVILAAMAVWSQYCEGFEFLFLWGRSRGAEGQRS